MLFFRDKIKYIEHLNKIIVTISYFLVSIISRYQTALVVTGHWLLVTG